jgi:hypothetical protein
VLGVVEPMATGFGGDRQAMSVAASEQHWFDRALHLYARFPS